MRTKLVVALTALLMTIGATAAPAAAAWQNLGYGASAAACNRSAFNGWRIECALFSYDYYDEWWGDVPTVTQYKYNHENFWRNGPMAWNPSGVDWYILGPYAATSIRIRGCRGYQANPYTGHECTEYHVQMQYG